MSFEVIPAIDLRDGGVVRLRQGDYAQQTRYRANPLELAKRYADAGAQWLHMVDLDGARSGGLRNLAVIETIARERLHVQAGGGVRNEADLRRLFDAGVARVVVGSVAVRDPERASDWLQRHGAQRIVIALDTRLVDGRWRLPTAGWTRAEPSTLKQLAPWYAARGARHLLCTDIERDGMLSGPNRELYAQLAQWTPGLMLQASGGVRTPDDIRALRGSGASVVILGRALLEGHFDIEDALAC